MYTRYLVKINEETGEITVVEDCADSISCWHIKGNNAEVISSLLKGDMSDESFNC